MKTLVVEMPAARPQERTGVFARRAFQALIERVSEVCWEATRAWVRSQFDSSTATDPRVPVKWTSASAQEQHDTRVQVLAWWAGGEKPCRTEPEINHVCYGIVAAFKCAHQESLTASQRR